MIVTFSAVVSQKATRCIEDGPSLPSSSVSNDTLDEEALALDPTGDDT